MTEEKKRKAKTGYNLGRDAIVIALMVRELLCVFSTTGTPIQRVATCCASSATTGSAAVPPAAHAEISGEPPLPPY